MIIPSNVTTIGEAAFSNCSGLDTLVFEDSETPLVIKYKERNESDIVARIYGPSNWYFGRDCQMKNVLNYWQNLKNLSIGKKVKNQTFSYCNILENIYCMTDSPELVACNFSSGTYVNAHLYVPTGTINKYKAAEGWKNFFNIQEMDVKDMWNGNIQPTNGDENGINPVRVNAVLIQSNNGILNISGADDGTCIEIYTTSGIIVGSAIASSSATAINTGLKNGEIAIVRIGNKSVKVMMR